MTRQITAEGLVLLLGLSFFFGLAFEEFYAKVAISRPGGVRTFPLLSLSGLGFYVLEPTHGLVFIAGLVVLGLWLHAFYRNRVKSAATPGEDGVGLMVPVCNLVAYLLGPIVLVEPTWVAISITVSAVLLLGARQPLHDLAVKLPTGEMSTAGKFLILSGIVLPLLPKEPVTHLTSITPYQVWLAVVAVSALSYGSYLLQRYLWPERGILLTAALGGLYSSTAATVALSRRLHGTISSRRTLETGIVLATTLMYLRLGVIVSVFNPDLALALAPALAVMFLLGLTAVALRYRQSYGAASSGEVPGNPLELTTAVIFALLFVGISIASGWVKGRFGQAGFFTFAGILGVTDIDPLVLSLAQGGGGDIPLKGLVAAILIAASSNNLLKAAYALIFGGFRATLAAALALLGLAALGFGLALWAALSPALPWAGLSAMLGG